MPVIEKFVNNPFAVKLGLATISGIIALLLAAMVLRGLRRYMKSQTQTTRVAQGDSGFAMAAYHSLARSLRERTEELRSLRQQYQAESALTSYIHEAVLENLTCGVLFFDRTGVVRKANPAAKSLLGYSSPFSFHFRDLFRGAARTQWQESTNETQSPMPLIQAMQETLRNGAPFPSMRVDYCSPSGQRRVLGVTAHVVRAKGGGIVGASCLIDDLTEMSDLAREVRRSETLASLGEISAGMIHDFKKSLSTVRGDAQALLRDRSDPDTYLCAQRIVAELDSLARIADEFLQFASSAKN